MARHRHRSIGAYEIGEDSDPKVPFVGTLVTMNSIKLSELQYHVEGNFTILDIDFLQPGDEIRVEGYADEFRLAPNGYTGKIVNPLW